MTNFGDSEPEDAWDASDSILVQLDNIRRRILLLAAAGDEGAWGDRETLRARDVNEDLLFVLARLRSG
jgi:hypothetical protein